MSLRSGSTVLHYRIERRLGAGGMGEVYLATDTTLNRSVAIKFLATPDDERARRRLLREARAAAGLDHPGVCAVYQIGTDATLGDFVVMQFVEGEPLSARLRRGRMDPTEALHVAEHVAEALMAAHGRGIVHRDLKPQNVILMPSGYPKLLDFGLAKRTLPKAAEAEAPTTAALTREHAILGTPGYQAPEQIRGGQVDRRADVFALGCVLYECLTGQRAFPGPTAADMMSQVLNIDPPPVSTVVPGLNDGFDALCARLLCKDVDGRCQSAEEALGSIRALLPAGTPASDPAWHGSRSSSSHGTTGRWPRWIVASLSVAVIGGVSVGVYTWRHHRSLPAPSPAAAEWFVRGVSAIREGAYAGARSSFEEAVKLDPQYAQAYARLADARHELDDEQGAQEALLHVNELVPDASVLDHDDQLRLEAVRASVLGEHDRALAAYQQLVTTHPKDPAALLDLGRAEEAGNRLAAARASYTKAIQLDGQYAAAYARVGFLQGTPLATALAQLDEAIRLYGTAADIEGKAEALLRKGALLTANGRYTDAQKALAAVTSLTTDPKYASQRIQADFHMARVTATLGHPAEAEQLTRKAVAEASAAGWQGLAADGLVDLGNGLLLDRRPEAAGQAFDQAISLAAAHGATRTQMRAQVSKASLRQATGFAKDAVDLCQAPLKFFADAHYTRYEEQAKGVLARADADLERYDEAATLTREVLASTEAAGNDEGVATALTTLAEQLDSLGRLPEELDVRNRVEAMHRQQNDQARLPYDLINRAQLLIILGRSADAEPAFQEVAKGVAAGIASYKSRVPRIALIRALNESEQLTFPSVLAAPALPNDPSTKDAALQLAVLTDHARAAIGRPTSTEAADEGRLAETDLGEVRRELAYWVADTLRLRGAGTRALAILGEALAEPGGQGNFELRWRLEALIVRLAGSTTDGGIMRRQAQADLQRLAEQWGEATKAYLERPDLKELQRALH